MAVGEPPIAGVNPSHTVSSIPAFTTGRAVTVIFTVSHCTQPFVSVTHTINWYTPETVVQNTGFAVLESAPKSTPGDQS